MFKVWGLSVEVFIRLRVLGFRGLGLGLRV